MEINNIAWKGPTRAEKVQSDLEGPIINYLISIKSNKPDNNNYNKVATSPHEIALVQL